MRKKQIISLLLAMVMLLAAAPVSLAAGSKQETAMPVTLGEEVTLTAERHTQYWYSVETDDPGQIIQLTSNHQGFDFYDPEGYSLSRYGTNSYDDDRYTYHAITDEAGEYGIRIYHSGSNPRDYAFTVTLLDNDACEPNNREDDAYALTSGKAVDFILDDYDYDYFTIETTRPGQDVRLDISGFTYETTGSLYLRVFGDEQFSIHGNYTGYYHAKNPGKHLISIDRYGDYEQFTLKATVLAGDSNEPNDTLEQATRLPVGTDQHFSMGGSGDEDWFVFESAFDSGESSKLYTLNLLDLASDYSDQFFYDLYAPDGTRLMSGMEVKIRHNNIIACEQEGLYALRLYRTSTSSLRSELRIRVDEGGADPYEPNDSWLTAADVQIGQPIQFILSNTEDADWFKFTVPDENMTVCLNRDSNVMAYLYTANDLQEFGPNRYLNYSSSASKWYYRLDTPGTYYMLLESDLSYISENLRTITLTLEEAGPEEPNNTWKTAMPIYEGVPVSFDTTASNDDEWFKFEIPEGVRELRVIGSESGWHYLYQGRDFETAGDNAGAIMDDHTNQFTLKSPAAGTYYLKWDDGRSLNQTIVYHLVMEDLPGQSIAEARPIREGEWVEDVKGGYYALGELKEGDQIRIYSENLSNVSLYDADEDYIYRDMYAYQNCAISVGSDGEKYLKVYPFTPFHADDSYKPYRFMFDIADRERKAGEPYTIEGPDSITVAVGEKVEVDLRLAPCDAKWNGDRYYEHYLFSSGSSSDPSTAACDANAEVGNYVTGHAVGTTTVRYYLDGYGYYDDETICKDITVNVVEPTPARSVTITNTPAHLPLGTSMILQTAITPANFTDGIIWTSSDPSILYVNESGKVTAVGDGSAVITASTSNGMSTSVTIAVSEAPAKPIVTGIKLDDYDMTLYMGEGDGQLTATVSPADSPVAVSWISSNLKAATVDQTGRVTPVAPGVAVITASAGDYRASCIVTVQAERINVESISFDRKELEIPLGGETVLRPIFNPTDATVQSVTWASTDPNVASVSRTGIVNALAVGETKIIATTLDGGKQASITIRITAAPQLGDINGDGYVDPGDAMMTLQVAVGKLTLNAAETEAADVNCDGWVDAADAVRILRYFAGYIDTLDN